MLSSRIARKRGGRSSPLPPRSGAGSTGSLCGRDRGGRGGLARVSAPVAAGGASEEKSWSVGEDAAGAGYEAAGLGSRPRCASRRACRGCGCGLRGPEATRRRLRRSGKGAEEPSCGCGAEAGLRGGRWPAILSRGQQCAPLPSAGSETLLGSPVTVDCPMSPLGSTPRAEAALASAAGACAGALTVRCRSRERSDTFVQRTSHTVSILYETERALGSQLQALRCLSLL